ncbi:MAG: GntR family transcriptional regulator [Planctomycetota bacterium]|jgi:DNA-binding GntR family transcriptional regulator|nr:GntR family transcriptional regulator [Planctomycetota bacterium]
MLNNTLGERVYQKIRGDILSGRYAPGDRLLFEDIARESGVSMTPVKEAFMLLEKEGLVFTVSRKGTFVRKFSRRDLEEFYQIRLALEMLAVDLACARGMSEEGEAELREICGVLEAHIENGDAAECVMDDVRFHGALVRLGGNDQLAKLMSALPLTNLFNMIDMADFYLSHGGDYLAEHRRIVRLLRKGDSEGVKKILRRHISTGGTSP